MKLEYIGTQNLTVTSDDKRSRNCRRYLDGLAAEDENCCSQCWARINCKPHEYAIRDRFGCVITADWIA